MFINMVAFAVLTNAISHIYFLYGGDTPYIYYTSLSNSVYDG